MTSNVPAPLSQPSSSFPQQITSPLHPSTVQFLIPQPLSLILQQCDPTLQLSVLNAPLSLIAVSLQGQGGPPPPPSVVRAYSPLISALIHQRFYPPLHTSDVPAPLLQFSALPLEPLALNHPPVSVSLQG